MALVAHSGVRVRGVIVKCILRRLLMMIGVYKQTVRRDGTRHGPLKQCSDFRGKMPMLVGLLVPISSFAEATGR